MLQGDFYGIVKIVRGNLSRSFQLEIHRTYTFYTHILY